MNFTGEEIKDLAESVGFVITEETASCSDYLETEMTVCKCGPGGIGNEDDDSVSYYRLIAYFSEYKEEGVFGLGKEIPEPEPTK